MYDYSQNPKDLLTRDEAASVAGCSTMTIRRAVYAGLLTEHRKFADKKRYISRADVVELFDLKPAQTGEGN